MKLGGPNMLARRNGVRAYTDLRRWITCGLALGLVLAFGWFFLQRGARSARAHYMQAFDSAKKKEYNEAIAEYDEAIRLAPRGRRRLLRAWGDLVRA